MMRTNFHTHTKRCGHAQGVAEDYVKAAIAANLTELGFSDHAPYPDYDFGSRMQFGELPEYLTEVDEVRAKYRSEIKIYKGLEIEYLPRYNAYYEELLTKYGIEYLLLGEHHYMHRDAATHNIYLADSTEDYVDYARTLAEGMHTGYFKAVAHLDVCMLNPFAWDTNCQKAADIIIDAAVATNMRMEYNANGLRRGLQDFPDGKRYPYPHDAFWKMAAEAKLRVFVGSDCHNPANVWDEAVEEAYKNLEEYQIEPICHLMD